MGDDHAYPMIAYGTMKKSSAWKMFAKSQGINFEIANEISNQIKRYESALNRAEEDEKGDIDPLDFIDPEFHEIFKRSEAYQGIITSWSIAPCSYLLYQGSIRREIGLVRIKDNLCCLMDGKWAEVYHFLKNDLLTVKVVDLIYRAYAQLGREPDSVNELLRLCLPDDPAWEVYQKGCTLGVNQCEQPGTSSRVGKYNPKNISEICAFVAAIRPGFKSMYKIFESRERFQYGVKAFDDLMTTPEMPSSFCIYQEQQMSALNYAGLEMSECYTAIKNIAKKRVEKVLEYKTVFLNGFRKAIIEQDGLPPDVADEKARMVWQIIEDSSRYSFNASHSYCVAIDSLYGAYLKAHHPLEFYSAFMQIQEKKGDKDKLTAARVEAEEYFKIHFQPYRFGQDNRDITVDRERFAINNSLSAIKGFGKAVGETIYEVGQRPHEMFMELLMDLDAHGLKSSKVEPLIKIDYFAQYGNSAELLRMNGLFEFFKRGMAKSIRKDKLGESPLRDIVARHASSKTKSGAESKSYTITDMRGLLEECEAHLRSLRIPDVEFRVKIQNQQEILGYIDLTTRKPEDRRKIIVTGLRPLTAAGENEPWGYAVFTRSIGSGKNARLTVRAKVFAKEPFQEMDVLYADELSKNKSGYWYLDRYHRIFA